VVNFFVRLSKKIVKVWIWLPSAKWLRTAVVEVKENVNYRNFLLPSHNDQTGSVVV